jgi:RNA polymerase sigma factor (TIGR02999 family)
VRARSSNQEEAAIPSAIYIPYTPGIAKKKQENRQSPSNYVCTAGTTTLISPQLPSPFHQWYISVLAKAHFPQAIAFDIYRTLRKNRAKTVMPVQDLSTSPGFKGGEPASTPEERRVLDELFSLTYEELRRMASSVRRNDARATLNPTALVNEAWLKLGNSPHLASTSPLHFKRIAARAMRQVLIEAARRRNADKRGSGAVFVTFDDRLDHMPSHAKELLALDRALDELAQLQPRQASMVESRFFGGLEVPEIAQLLEVSEATILRDWRAAKAWLAHKLREAR